MLSPGTGQVTHVLLTRPPLKCNESNRNLHQNISVRLACVRHAASVHPEPGSNSLVKRLLIRFRNTSFLTVLLFKVVLENLLNFGTFVPRSLPYRPLFLEFSGFYVLFSFQCPERRRRDLNPRTVTSDLLPFQGSPFNHLGTSARA